jgi:FkbM family methyltransferase
MWYLKSVPFSKAYCLEPSLYNLERGMGNMQLNNLEAEFIQASIGRARANHQPFRIGDKETIYIPQHTVQSAMDHFKLPELEMLHMDIDGGELAVLRSCEHLFKANKIRFLVVSTHHKDISKSATTHADCLGCIMDSGAYIIAEHLPEESFGGDGLIVASTRQEDRVIPMVKLSRYCAA